MQIGFPISLSPNFLLLLFAISAIAALFVGLWREQSRAFAFETRYAALCAHREDAIYHFRIAERDGDERNAAAMRAIIARATEEILRIRREYNLRFRVKAKNS